MGNWNQTTPVGEGPQSLWVLGLHYWARGTVSIGALASGTGNGVPGAGHQVPSPAAYDISLNVGPS